MDDPLPHRIHVQNIYLHLPFNINCCQMWVNICKYIIPGSYGYSRVKTSHASSANSNFTVFVGAFGCLTLMMELKFAPRYTMETHLSLWKIASIPPPKKKTERLVSKPTSFEGTNKPLLFRRESDLHNRGKSGKCTFFHGIGLYKPSMNNLPFGPFGDQLAMYFDHGVPSICSSTPNPKVSSWVSSHLQRNLSQLADLPGWEGARFKGV